MDAVAVSTLGPCFPPPPFNRMPPDGHEFPQKYREEMPGKLTADNDLRPIPPLPTSEPPRKLDILPSKAKAVGSWRQDERSGKSVRDKIAMFQSVPDCPVGPAGYVKLCKYKSSEDVFYDDDDRTLPQSKLFSRSVVSVDKLGSGFIRKHSLSAVSDGSGDYARTQSSMDLTSSSSSAYSSSCSPDSSLSSTTSSYIGYSSTLPRKTSRPSDVNEKAGVKTNGVTRTSSFNVHSRSQSMLDINPPPFIRSRESRDEEKQTSLNTLVEQRRKTMSKLRGLVIPERISEPEILKQPILDLPEIKSRDSIRSIQPISFEKERRTSTGCLPPYNPPPSTHLLSPWKAPNQSPAIPKYSPAFKRKNISVYGTSTPDYTDRFKTSTMSAPTKPPRSNGIGPRHSFDSIKPPIIDCTPDFTGDKQSYQRLGVHGMNDYSTKSLDFYPRKSLNSDRCRSEEDSDNDSAVSSSRSSISPPASPLLGGHQGLSSLDIEKSPLARTLSSETNVSGTSTASTLTSRSHASCSSDSDSHSKRVLKAQSVEAINRKNVLTSAKYSRGFDIKNGSPLIQRKSPERGCDTIDSKDPPQLYEPVSRKISNDDSSNEIVCYKLAENYRSCGRTPEVKIAFLNHIEGDDDCEVIKNKLNKTESVPINVSSHPPLPVPRRVSVPICSTWGNDWSEIKPEINGHLPLTPNISSDSIRSRASSADTIVEKPMIFEAELTPSRIRTVHTASASETEDNFLDDTAESGPEDNLPCSITGRSSLGSDSVSSGWSYRASDPNESPTEIGSSSSVRAYIGNSGDSILRKRGSSGSLLDGLDDSQDKRGRSTADRINARNRRSVSVNDIRKAFEKAEHVVSAKIASEKMNGSHARVSSIDSTTSDDSNAPYDTNTNLQREQFGSITSLASSTSLISPQELQSLIDEANLTLEETIGSSGCAPASSHDVVVVILHRDSIGGSVGITLAGGADYEAKEITVHKVLAGSPADRDGRIQKGDRILSINGKSMKGATHRESLAILKSPRPEVVLVVSRLKSESGDIQAADGPRTSRPPRILEGSLLTDEVIAIGDDVARGPPSSLQLVKDGAGLGFSLEGGKDSPLGDKPLVVKKIFTGGAAEKSGLLKAGDEILNVNGVDVSHMSRIEAWKLMKRLPDGKVSVTIRRVVENVIST